MSAPGTKGKPKSIRFCCMIQVQKQWWIKLCAYTASNNFCSWGWFQQDLDSAHILITCCVFDCRKRSLGGDKTQINWCKQVKSASHAGQNDSSACKVELKEEFLRFLNTWNYAFNSQRLQKKLSDHIFYFILIVSPLPFVVVCPCVLWHLHIHTHSHKLWCRVGNKFKPTLETFTML